METRVSNWLQAAAAAVRSRVDTAQLILWSSYKGQTVDALAVGGDEGRG